MQLWCVSGGFCVAVDQEIIYLMKDAMEYRVDHEGKIISLIENLGIIIDIPPGAIPDHHPDEVIIRINACIRGPFVLPDGYELVTPVFQIEPGAKFADKPVELSMVHFLNIKDESHCSELNFVSAPYKPNSNIKKESIEFKLLDGGKFRPGSRIGRIALQHFCLIGIVKQKDCKQSTMAGEASSTMRPAIPSKSM